MPSLSHDSRAISKHAPPHSIESTASQAMLQRKLYKKLLEKHAATISEKAPQTVGEIKSMVDKDDLTIQFLVQSILPQPYDFDRDYDFALGKLFESLQSQVEFVKTELDINFWLKPKEVLDCKVADDEDLALLLCSASYALGDDQAHVAVCELENLTAHAVVLTEWRDQFYLLDLCQKKPFNSFIGEKNLVLEQYDFEGNKIRRFLYRFNAKNYEQFL